MDITHQPSGAEGGQTALLDEMLQTFSPQELGVLPARCTQIEFVPGVQRTIQSLDCHGQGNVSLWAG